MNIRSGRSFAFPEMVFISAVILLGLLLRWYRLDLMSFRFDSAEAMFRARDTFMLGFPPLTGIENSLGFRNPAGFVWLILPTALITPRPEITAAWIGLITMSAIPPLYASARKLTGRAPAAFAATVYAVLPAQVFAGRAIWAQHLLPPLAAWAVWFYLRAIDSQGSGRASLRYAFLSIFTMLVAVSVHLSAIAYLPLLVIALWPTWKGVERPRLIKTIASLIVILAAMTAPSGLDWVNKKLSLVSVKPDYVLQFESNMPESKPFVGRLVDAGSGVFDPFQSRALFEEVADQISPAFMIPVKLSDFLLLILTFLGIVILALKSLPRENHGKHCSTFRLFLVWIFLPPAGAAIFLGYPNGSYFAMTLPVLLISNAIVLGASLSTKLASRGQMISGPKVSLALVLVVAIAYSLYTLMALGVIDRNRNVRNSYYLPLVELRTVAKYLAEERVSAGRVKHFSGDWFQRSYDYLHQEEFGMAKSAVGRIALMDDILLRRTRPAKQAYLKEQLHWWRGSVGVTVFDQPADARPIFDKLNELGKTSPPDNREH